MPVRRSTYARSCGILNIQNKTMHNASKIIILRFSQGVLVHNILQKCYQL